jgi:hypothetical protein
MEDRPLHGSTAWKVSRMDGWLAGWMDRMGSPWRRSVGVCEMDGHRRKE